MQMEAWQGMFGRLPRYKLSEPTAANDLVEPQEAFSETFSLKG